MSGTGITEAMVAVANWAQALGVRRIDHLDGCWERAVDGHWWVALNGHAEPRTCTHGVVVAPYECIITYNGWLAGGFDGLGGSIVAGEDGNEDTFIAAVRAATERAATERAATERANEEG